MHGIIKRTKLSLGEAKLIIGSIGAPSKIPGTSYGLPAKSCIVGAKLAEIKQTACSLCYAMRGKYFFTNVAKSQQRRLASITHPKWVEAMVRILSHMHSRNFINIDLGIKDAKARGLRRSRLNEAKYHRWHDSGDLQSIEHLANICEVARQTPQIKYWMPTQELGLVKRYVEAGGNIPKNLVIRVSSIMIDDTARRSWPHTSSVAAVKPPSGHLCPAPQQNNTCGKCRACWSSDVAHVTYHLH